jgi:hypothetical protein
VTHQSGLGASGSLQALAAQGVLGSTPRLGYPPNFMAPPVTSMPARKGSRRRAGRRATALLLAAAFTTAGCSGKSSPPVTPPVEQVPPPILTGGGAPTGATAGGTIGSAGGTVQSPDGRFMLLIPAGAVATDVPFTVQPVTNTAIGGVGGAFRLRPEGLTLSKPVTLVLSGPPTYQPGADIEGLGVSYQDATGFWYPVKGVIRDAVRNTLTVTTDHFSDWGVTWQAGVPGLYGSYTLDQTVEIPFTASGKATLFYQGSNTTKTLYVLTGEVTVPASIPYQAATCVPAAPYQTMAPTVAELWSAPSQFRWSINGQWDLTCAQPGGGTTPQFISAIFDTLGINLIGCTRGYVGTPILGADRVTGTYLIDCGTRGHVQASWDFVACVPGVQCAGPNPCTLGAIDCTTGNPVCADTGTPIPSGTSCGTDQVCLAGACGPCVAGVACAAATACDIGVTDCGTGTETCRDTLATQPDGTPCGTNQACRAGACVACEAGVDCTAAHPGSCTEWRTSCASGAQACVATQVPVTSGTACGSGLVCAGGACVACADGGACQALPGSCTLGALTCAPTPACSATAIQATDGTACGADQVCLAGSCVACTAGVPCAAPAGSCTSWQTSCATGAVTCSVDTTLPGPNGTDCGGTNVCQAGLCTACAPGADCTAANPCHVGVLSCTLGPRCVDTAALRPAGTACGPSGTCQADGSCR